MDLPYLNDMNGASTITLEYAAWIARLFERPVGAEFGVPYGGNVQRLGRLWKPHGGTVHGFDTFGGHPKQLASSPDAFEATCMDIQYAMHGTGGLSYEFQRRVLDEEGLDNAFLHAGLIDEHSLDDVPHLHYAMLDMDLVKSMRTGWQVVRFKIVPGGFLLLHDVVPPRHIDGLYDIYQEIVATGEYDVLFESFRSYLAVLKRRKNATESP